MARHGLTKERVDGAKSRTRQGKPVDTFLFDQKVTGFGLKISAGGAKSFFVQYRKGKGRAAQKRRYTIGRYGSPWTVDTARDEALRILGRVAGGGDPANERKIDPVQTVRRLSERFLAVHAAKKKPRTEETYRDLTNRMILPQIGGARVPELTTEHVADMHYQLRRTPVSANRSLATLSKMLAWGHRNGFRLPGDNPCKGIEKYKEQKRERYLKAAELARLGDALAAADADPANLYQVAAIRLLIFTGARLSEILTLQWDWADLDHGLIRLPDSKTGAKTIHLSGPARAVLDALPRIKGNPFVIAGAKDGAHLVNLEKPWRRIRDDATRRIWADSTDAAVSSLESRLASKLERHPTIAECQAEALAAKVELPIGLLDLRLHDLRHSFASVGAGAGLGLPMIGKLLGHSQPATTARYAHLDADPVKAANEAIGRRIAAAMAGSASGKVVSLPKRKA